MMVSGKPIGAVIGAAGYTSISHRKIRSITSAQASVVLLHPMVEAMVITHLLLLPTTQGSLFIRGCPMLHCCRRIMFTSLPTSLQVHQPGQISLLQLMPSGIFVYQQPILPLLMLFLITPNLHGSIIYWVHRLPQHLLHPILLLHGEL